MRDISAQGQALLESGEFQRAYLLTLHTDPAIHLTTHHRKITYGAATFLPAQGEVKIPSIVATTEDRKGTKKFVLPNVDGIFDGIVESQGYADKWVNVGIVILTLDDVAVDVIDYFNGSVTGVVTLAESAQISCASYHTIFEEKRGLRTTEVSHQAYVGVSSVTNDYTMHWANSVTDFEMKTGG